MKNLIAVLSIFSMAQLFMSDSFAGEKKCYALVPYEGNVAIANKIMEELRSKNYETYLDDQESRDALKGTDFLSLSYDWHIREAQICFHPHSFCKIDMDSTVNKFFNSKPVKQVVGSYFKVKTWSCDCDSLIEEAIEKIVPTCK